jgi:hypothetical protein
MTRVSLRSSSPEAVATAIGLLLIGVAGACIPPTVAC